MSYIAGGQDPYLQDPALEYAPTQAMGAIPHMGAGGGKVELKFHGTGGGLFVNFLIGYLLTLITFGIYMPWFMVRMTRYIFENSTIAGTRRGTLVPVFVGSGGKLFVLFLVGYLLTLLTLGIYGAWFMRNLVAYLADHSSARAQDGTEYKLHFGGTGGKLFVTFLVGYLLTLITIGIYMPWFMCKIQRYIKDHMAILENNQPIGKLSFVGTGGSLFVTFLVGYLLTLITFGIYMPWFTVKLTQFFVNNTRVHVAGRTLAGNFGGTGGQLFVLFLVGYLLTLITVGIYAPWFMAKWLRFRIDNTSYAAIG